LKIPSRVPAVKFKSRTFPQEARCFTRRLRIDAQTSARLSSTQSDPFHKLNIMNLHPNQPSPFCRALLPLCALVSLSCCTTLFGGTNQTTWFNDPEIFDWLGVEVPEESAPEEPTWAIRIYKSLDSDIEFSLGLPTSDDVWTGIEFHWHSGGAPGYSVAIIHDTDINYNLLSGDKCYSVLFDNHSAAAATRFVVIDDSVATVLYGPVGFDYNPGGAVAGDWQAVPEPAAGSLLVAGFLAAMTQRRRGISLLP
jgi:hypothetical protein